MKRKIRRSNTIRRALKIWIYDPMKSTQGFTLLELMVAMGIGLVVLAGLYNLFTTQNKSFSAQELIVEMQQNGRAAMDMMATEMRMAGYDPAHLGTSASFYITSAAAQSMTFKQNLNGDTDLDDNNENITYGYDSTNLRINRNTGGGAQPYAENIEALNFSYYDAAGATTATLDNIRKIKIEIRARTARSDPDYSTNGGYRTFTLTSYVTPRNLAY